MFTVPKAETDPYLVTLSTEVMLQVDRALVFIFVKPSPPEHMRLRYFDCTSSKATPILDTVGAGLEGASTVYLLSADSAAVHAPPSHAGYIALGLGITALYIASAVYGYSHTSECAHAQDELQGTSRTRTA